MGEAYYKLPKALTSKTNIKDLSCGGIVLYAIMRDRAELSKANGIIDQETGRPYIYFTLENVMECLGCSKGTAQACINKLEQARLIEKRKRPNKATKYFVLEVQKTEVQNLEVRSSKIELPAVQKLDPNKTKYNKTKINKTNTWSTEDMETVRTTQAVCEMFNERRGAVQCKGRVKPGATGRRVICALLAAGYSSSAIIEAAARCGAGERCNWNDLEPWLKAQSPSEARGHKPTREGAAL